MQEKKSEKKKKPKVVVIVGATATGKSDLAIKLAKKFNGEVISADSRQVYKGLDIGTGKITKSEMQGIPHHMIDVVSPNKKFNVVDFQNKVFPVIKDIVSRGKIPMICGGTGFYIDAIIKGIIYPEVPPNPKLRKQLTKKSATALFLILEKLDMERAKNIDPHNKVRLIRAIEIVRALGKVPRTTNKKPIYEFIKIGLVLPESAFKKKVELRVKKMFEQGLLTEIKNLNKKGITKKRLREFGFEYNNPSEEKVILGTVQYAKRQMTWFKRDTKISWYAPSDYKKIEKYLKIKL